MSAAPMDSKLQIEVKGGASAQIAGQEYPNLSDMETRPPIKENMGSDLGLSPTTSVAEISAEERGNEPAEDLAVGVEMKVKRETSKENPEKCDTVDENSSRKMSPLRSSAEGVEATRAGPQIEDGETINVEAVTDQEAMEAHSQTNGLENAEITLVVEVNTDAELVDDSGKRQKESMQGGVDTLMEHSRDAVTGVEVLEQVGSLLSTNEDTGTNPGNTASCRQCTETMITKSTSQQRMENVRTPDHPIDQDAPAASPMHAEVCNQTSAFKKGGVTDGAPLKESELKAKGVERKGEEGPVHAETQFGQDAERSRIGEETGISLFSTEESEVKPVCVLNVTRGSAEEMDGVTHDEERRNGEIGGVLKGSIDMDVEMEAGTRPSRKRGLEEGIGGDRLLMNEDAVDGERKKDGMAVTEAAVSELQAESSLCMKGVDKDDFVEGCEGSERGLAEEMVGISKEKNTDLLENEGVQAGSLLASGRSSGVREGLGISEGTIDPTVVLGNKEAIKEGEHGQWSKSHTDADTVMFDGPRMNANVHQHMGSVSGENTKERRQGILCEREADIGKVTSGRGSDPQHQDVESGSGLGIRQDTTMGEECHLLVEAGKEVQGEADHIALFSNKETSKEVGLVKAEQGGQRKEEAHHLFGQEVQASPAVQSILHNPMSKDVVVAKNYSEGERRVQLERQQNRQVHAEMRVRLHAPEKRAKADFRKGQEVLGGISGMQTLKDLPLAKRKEVKEEELGQSIGQHWRVGIVMQVKAKADTMSVEGKQQGHMDTRMQEVGYEQNQGWSFQGTSYENAARGISRGERADVFEEERTGVSDEANTGTSEEEKISMIGLEKGPGTSEKATLKRKLSENLASDSVTMNEHGQIDTVVKKAKKKAVNVWAKTSSRKGPKKNSKNGVPQNPPNEASVLLTPVYVNPDKLEDGPDQPIALSKYDKAEKIELSENRLSASSTKGYRMVRATRGVQEGTWYFEIVVEQLGPTGHTRLGWSTQKGDVQAPVGFDCNSYGYRDLDGSKTHVAVREPYGDFYVEGDVIGFYIHLPNGAEYAPKPAPVHSYGGRPYLSDVKEEHPRKVPGSEICFFRNGVCQGTAFKDINAGRYFPAASMYTLPKEPNCTVRFNFGPEFRFPPVDIGDRSAPMAMFHAPYHNVLNGKEVGPVANVSTTGNATLNSEPQMKIV